MKRKFAEILLLSVIVLSFPVLLIAASIEVSWNANTEADLAGYKIHYGTQTGSYTSTLNTGKVTTATIENLQAGSKYYISVTAYDSDGNESEYSQEVSITIPFPDTTPPTGSVIISEGAAISSSRTVTLGLTATDNQGTVAAMKISNDGINWSAEAPFSSTQAWVLASGDGNKTVYVLFKDSNGNWMTNPVSASIELILDSNGDGIPDVWCIMHAFDVYANISSLDSDGDGYSNYEEFVNGSNPNYRYDFAPVVEAGPSQQRDPTRIYFDGSASYDPNGDSISYSWSQASGPQIMIENPSSINASFMGVKSGAYRFMLSCSDGRAVSTDTVDIIINNIAPSINAGNDMTVDSGTTMIFHAVGSDPNGDALTYTWSKVEGPGIMLPAMNTQDISLTPQNAGLYRFRVVCSDGATVSELDEIMLTVNAVNHAPTADAGDDADVQTGTLLTLDGSKSSDPDNDQLAYSWRQVSGALVSLADSKTAKASFNALATGTYVFELTVADALISSTPDTVTVRVLKLNTSPVAEAGDDQTTEVGKVITLDAAASYDPDADAMTYSWSQTEGASVQLYGTASANPTFTPTVSGVLEFKVVVYDGQAQAEDRVKVTVQSINSVPVADAGEPQTVTISQTLGQRILLDGSQSSDPDGNTLSYIWSQISGPSVSLSGANTSYPWFSPSTEGLYAFELKVYDGKDTSAADTVTITVQNVQAVISLSSPKNDASVASNPRFKWNSSSAMQNYSLYIALDGTNYTKMYCGNFISYVLHSVLWYWFIPKNTTVSWYVEGLKGDVPVKSRIFRFKKIS